MPNSNDDNSTEDLDTRMSSTLDQIYQMRVAGRARSALRAANEVKRLAKAEKRLVPYLHANFHVMNIANSLLDPRMRREAAVESVALLESSERARAFQSDYPEREYERIVAWMSACSYDNLALATANLNGYNSEGMQALIAEGIGVCRRTGKLECIACFREYATAVFRAADDLEMALHHARTNLSKAKDARNFDRRWVGAHDEADLLLLAGQLGPARDAALRALELAPAYHSPPRARRKTLVLLNAILLLDGREKEYAALAAPHQAAMSSNDTPDESESPDEDLFSDMLEALGDCCRGEYASAIETLVRWDRELTANKSLHDWFEVRLRLIAATKMSGAEERLGPLISQLESRAREAQDFLTLRRLRGVQNAAQPANPFLPARPFASGRFAATKAPASTEPGGAAASAPTEAQPAESTAPVGPQRGPLGTTIDRLGGLLQSLIRSAQESNAQPDAGPILQELLAIPPGTVTHANDAGRFLHMAPYIAYNAPTTSSDPALWDWANAVAANLSRDAGVISLLATLGNALRHRENSPLTEKIQADDLAALFRRSLDLDSNGAALWARAGLFHLDNQNYNEAERCLARASRLDRADEAVALRLADLYTRSDRPSDALFVLDMCLRSGSVTPPVLWEAALLASSLQQNDLVLLYLERFESLQPGRLWAGYYKAMALLNLRRPKEAAEAIDIEAQRSAAASVPTFHVISVRAAIAAELGSVDALREQIAQALATPLRLVTSLTPSGLASCLARLWAAAQLLPEGDDLRRQLEDRILASGLVPETLWRFHRDKAAVTPNLSHFIVTLLQPLDDRWSESPAAIPGQEKWRSYRTAYGVLAADEDQAKATALSWQQRCAPLPAEVESVESDNGRYTDKPGVTRRRFPQADS